jgi:D-alanyl-D-alanine dipeptidase
MLSCTTKSNKAEMVIIKKQDTVIRPIEKAIKIVSKRKKSKLEKALIKQGLVNLQKLDTSIQVKLMYSTADNFVGIDMYGDFDQAYLYPKPAKMLLKAQRLLQAVDTSYALIVYDAVRPLHIQQQMWDTLKIPFKEKIKFLSNPKNGSIHNYGAAVDLSIVKNGKPIDMGTPYDYLGKLAYPRLEKQLLTQGKLTQKQIDNRKLLRQVMFGAGFAGITTEWWHFNSLKRREAKQKYKVVL